MASVPGIPTDVGPRVGAKGHAGGTTATFSVREAYAQAVRNALPQLIETIDPAPWYCEVTRAGRAALREPATLLQQLEATLAAALVDDDRADRGHVECCVRAALVRWQLTLCAAGMPLAGRVRRSPLLPRMASAVTRLLSESSDLTSHELVVDLERHLRWLMSRPPYAPSGEAALISAMVDGALLIRDATLLRAARDRLGRLLLRQDTEGWFPERGGADCGRLSLTLDALARIHLHHHWAELAEPLQRALRFVTHMVHPDMHIGGCVGSCGQSHLGPYGVELLASEYPEAALLARACRHHAGEAMSSGDGAVAAQVHAAWASGMALATTVHDAGLEEAPMWPFECRGWTHFPHAGLTIVSTDAYYAVVSARQGGALRVTWRNGGDSLEDAGVTAVWSHRLKISGGHSNHTSVRTSAGRVESAGRLRTPRREGRRRWSIVGWCAAALGSWLRFGSVRHTCSERSRSRDELRRRVADRFRRVVTFEDGKLHIHDVVCCRLPCAAVVCQEARPGGVGPLPGEPQVRRAPVFVEGARRRSIARTYASGRLIECRATRAD